jgi:hypothetical protein
MQKNFVRKNEEVRLGGALFVLRARLRRACDGPLSA